MERLPANVMNKEILMRLDLETLCSVASVNSAMRFSVDSHTLPLLPSLHLSEFCPDADSLNHVLRRCRGVRSLTLNCLRLHDSFLLTFLAPNIQQLNLMCCSFFRYQVLVFIAQNCPFLRVLMLELKDQGSPNVIKRNLSQLLSKCLYLESLCLKVRGAEVDANVIPCEELCLPKTMKILKLKPVLEIDVIRLIKRLQISGDFSKEDNPILSVPPFPSYFTMQSLSLVLDVISDVLLITITNLLPLLVELNLEDRPNREPLVHHDLTNTGLQYLGSCRHLTSISLIRGRQKHHGSFTRVNDMGMFLFFEACKGLESVRVCGFSRVRDAGFASILHSCRNLKKLELRNALYLSDLAFHDIGEVPCALVEVRLLSCRLITNESVNKLASSRSLEVLDLCGCKSISDACFDSISHLYKLTTLNLTGANVSDNGLSVLGQGSPPITRLCLRGCERVTDDGISLLLQGIGTIRHTLSCLDLGYMPRISDKGILTIAAACSRITELCLRCCFYITNSSLEALATRKKSEDGVKQLQRLDLYHCTGLSDESFGLLRRPLFCGLQWLGIGNTYIRDATVTEIRKDRPWLTLCLDGCEMGCHDGWQFHKSRAF